MTRKKALRIISLLISLAVFVACGVYFGLEYLEYRSSTHLPSAVTSVEKPTKTEEKQLEIPVNFNELVNINEDIYAWINIPDTNIDFPVVQSRKGENRSYYLNHNVNRKKSMYGAIYTQNYNSKDFNDYNTVIYGHDMFNGTMFGTLKKFRNREYFDSHKEIIIYMPNRILKYRIFGAFVFDDRHILMSFDFDNPSERELYLETIFSDRQLSSNFDSDVSVTTEDKLITLSTCTSKEGERYLIQGVLVYDSDTDT